jgi:hypothetical protein
MASHQRNGIGMAWRNISRSRASARGGMAAWRRRRAKKKKKKMVNINEEK